MASFSKKLRSLLNTEQPITIRQLTAHFAEKSFAVLLLILLAIPALPLPTGGITHIFEIIAALLSVELMAGRKTVWLPRKWLDKNLPKGLQSSALPRFIQIIDWAERHSKPRLRTIQASPLYTRATGVVVLVFTAFAFLAPPFSGLDTLPSLGVVVISLSLIFGDALLGFVGLLIGCIGIVLTLLLSRLAFQVL